MLNFLVSQYEFLQLKGRLEDRPGDALAVAIHLLQQSITKIGCDLFEVSILVFGLFEEVFQIQWVGNLYKEPLGRAKNNQPPAEPPRVFLTAEYNVNDVAGWPVGLLTEEKPLRDNVYGTIDRLLQFDEICSRLLLGLDKSSIKTSGINQRKES
jgi:hypothetical protein